MESLHTPLQKETLSRLTAGDSVLLSGTLYTARDAAHKRLVAMLDAGEPLPFSLPNQCIYYVGPCPAPPGRVIGPCGPTTSGRMDAYAPALFDRGLAAVIGKGNRSPAVIDALVRSGAVYFAATGGAAALLSRHVKAAELIAFEDLGAEGIYRLKVENFPLIVAIDSRGNNLYLSGPMKYRTAKNNVCI
ncbi:MAG: Fe-S-containing hydro-lyase [Christensenellales bacterium]|jgi:fumarate hydratase subunit beta